MSRFNTELKIDILKFHKNVRDYPYYTFAADFVHFVLQECGFDWAPLEIENVVGVSDKVGPRPKCYSPHPLSPCTETIKRAVAKMLNGNSRDFTKTYDRLAADSTSKLESFQEHIEKVFDKLIRIGGSPFEMLFKLFYVGKMTAVFYELGTTQAADLAIPSITTALRQINGTNSPAVWFESMNVVSKEVLSWYEDDPELTIDVYMSGVDSDQESSDSTEEEEDSSASDEEMAAERKNLSKKDGEEYDKLDDSAELDNSYAKSENSSDKVKGRLSDESDRAYDASCSSNNEPESED